MNWQTLFEDKTGCQVERLRARHRHIIYGTTYRQAADITAREKQRGNDVCIGGDGELSLKFCAVWQQQTRRIIPSGQGTAYQAGHEHFADQVLRHAAAAAMPDDDLFGVIQRHRAGRSFHAGNIVDFIHVLRSSNSDNRPRRRLLMTPS
jgi:hypothetical protein